MSTERFKNVTSFVINLLNNKTIILLNLAEYRLILADEAVFLIIQKTISSELRKSPISKLILYLSDFFFFI